MFIVATSNAIIDKSGFHDKNRLQPLSNEILVELDSGSRFGAIAIAILRVKQCDRGKMLKSPRISIFFFPVAITALTQSIIS